MSSKLRIVVTFGLLVLVIGSKLSIASSHSNPVPVEAHISARAANPNVLPAAQAILDTITDLPNRTGNRVISGQFGSYGEGADAATAADQLQTIYNQSGKWVALTGMDYHTWDLYHLHNYTEPNSYLIDQWNKGSLVTVSWHSPNPWTHGEADDMRGANGQPTANLNDLITSGTAANKAWMAMLDDVAGGLQQLKNAGVIVIWRPFHEMNGGWFWWHEQPQADFVALWRHMFNYFTVTKGLNNLLWAYSPNTNNNQWNARSNFYYPGDGYVDIVGLDHYMGRGEDPLKLNDWHEYDDLVALGKPMGLLEFGPSPADGSGWQDPKYDAAKLIRDIRTLYPKIAFFDAWEYIWQIGDMGNVSGLINDPWVITRDELPKWNTTTTSTSPTTAPTIKPSNTPIPPTSVATKTPVPPTTAASKTPVPPTSVATNTPVPPTAPATSTSAPVSSGTFKVQYRAGDTRTSTNWTAAYLQVFNMGASAVQLSQLKLRYWFTSDSTQLMMAQCSYASGAGCIGVTSSFNKLTTPVSNADMYLEIGFNGNAGMLAASGQFAEVDTNLQKADNSAFIQSNDYSFDATKTNFADWNKVTLYYNGVLVWGTPPVASAPAPATNTPVPPTVVKTATPIQNTPIASGTTLKAQYKTGNTTLSSNQFQPTLNIVNATGSAIPLSELKIRYYFTRDTAQSLVFHCDWAQIGCANVTGRFVPLSAPVSGADYYMEIGFTSAAGSIAANGKCGEIWTRVNKSDWSNFNQSNDFSFDASKTVFTDWMRVSVYRNGVLVWGMAPNQTVSSGSLAVPTTPAPAPTFVPR